MAAALFLLWDEKGGVGVLLEKIGIPPRSWLQALAYSLAGLAAVILLLFVLSIMLSSFGYADNQKVFEKLEDVPLWILPFAVIVAPFTEEVLFRAALVPRIGVVGSSMVFGILHLFYGSVMEVAGTVAVGIVLALIFVRTKSILPCIVIHLAFNSLTILAVFYQHGAVV